MPLPHRCSGPPTLSFALLVFLLAPAAGAQSLTANDDRFGVPFGEPLVVEAFGVLDNDVLDGENAGEAGATAELVTDVSYGTLSLGADGAFSYSPGASFDGVDQFVYRARFGGVSAIATVILSACTGGPLQLVCWNEHAYRLEAAALGLLPFDEGFEDDATWGIARSPSSAAAITSQGIVWQSNHPDPPASNTLTTGPGPARTGAWAVFDPEHGYAPTPSLSCDDNEDPPIGCFYHDGFSGTRVAGLGPLHGVGGYITGIFGAKVVAILDDDEASPIGLGQLGTGHRFLGVLDAGPLGFQKFEIREIEGRAGNALYIWADDFTLLVAEPAIAVPASSALGLVGLGLSACGAGLMTLRRRASRSCR